MAFLFNFVSYGGLVFGGTSIRLLPRFLLFYAMLGSLNYLLLRLLNLTGYGPFLAQALRVPVLAICGYVGFSCFVFDRRAKMVAIQ